MNLYTESTVISDFPPDSRRKKTSLRFRLTGYACQIEYDLFQYPHFHKCYKLYNIYGFVLEKKYSIPGRSII